MPRAEKSLVYPLTGCLLPVSNPMEVMPVMSPTLTNRESHKSESQHNEKKHTDVVLPHLGKEISPASLLGHSTKQIIPKSPPKKRLIKQEEKSHSKQDEKSHSKQEEKSHSRKRDLTNFLFAVMENATENEI